MRGTIGSRLWRSLESGQRTLVPLVGAHNRAVAAPKRFTSLSTLDRRENEPSQSCFGSRDRSFISPSFQNCATTTFHGINITRRYFTTNERKEPPKRLSQQAVDLINSAIMKHPQETVLSFVLMDISTVLGTYYMLTLAQVDVPVEFALAFALSRPLRRFRLPVEIAGAAGLAYAFPALTQVKISELRKIVPESMRRDLREGPLKWGVNKMGDVIDKYGAAYFLSSRWLGVNIVLLLYAGILNGFEVTSFVETNFGALGSTLGSIAGTWAAAVCMSSSIYPLSMVAGGGLAHGLGRARVYVNERYR